MKKVLCIILLVFTVTLTIPGPLPETDYDWEQIDCLAKNIYFESRGEPHAGQVAVAAVTINRVKSVGWPGDVCGVVYQKKQFSWVDQGYRKIRDKESWAKAQRIAYDYWHGRIPDPTGGAQFFHVKTLPYNWKARKVVIIGNHKFYIPFPSRATRKE